MTSTKVFYVFVFILVSFLFNTKAYSQENFIPGSIFTLNGDTIKGMIDYRNWAKNPISVTFKAQGSEAVNIYSPKAISGFSVNNDLYLSALVQAEISPDQLDDLSRSPEIIIRKDSTFLQTMVLGSKSLYSYLDINGKQHYYIYQWPDFELLIHKKYLKDNPEKADPYSLASTMIVSENNKYKGQLILYFQDCPTIQSKIATTEYTQKSLLQLFETYQKCNVENGKKEASPSYQYSGEKLSLQFGLTAGPLLGSIVLTSNNVDGYNYVTNVDYPFKLGFTGGIFLDVVLPRNQERYSVFTDLAVSTFKTGNHFDVPYNGEIVAIDTEFDFTQLKLTSMLRYKFIVKDNWSAFSNAGLQYGYTLTESQSVTVGKEQNEEPLFVTHKTDFKFAIGLGLGHKNLTFETRYEFGGALSGQYDVSLKTNLLIFFVGYRF